jgi:rhamnose utilization protein RhaD (predicted bifunctional aldolase and dehydrogenase)
MPATVDTSTEQLAELARQLGRADRDWAILAEGNVASLNGGSTVTVKASGASMSRATVEDMTQVELSELLALIDDPEAGDADVARVFDAAAARAGGRRPSVESLLHAVCLDRPGITVVGHTHPVAVNALLCSRHASLLTSGALFPDQIVVLGTNPMLIPYVDPGLRLAQEVRRRLHDVELTPRVIYLRNHGMFALGASAAEVQQITAMADKVARVILGALAAGGPVFMEAAEVERIDTRPDELLRRAALGARMADDREVAGGQPLYSR